MIKNSGWTVLSFVVLFSVFNSSATANSGLINPDFQAGAGEWSDGSGPSGWILNLDADDQRGLVAPAPGAEPGRLAFHFNRVERGFGSSRLEQCVRLDSTQGIQLSAEVWTDEPHPELSVRLRIDFFADDNCNTDSINADAEQIQTDIGLSQARVPASQWTRLESETRLPGELGGDVRSARISLRLRDRSEDGQPREPSRIVWFDQVSLSADFVLLPEAQRGALRALYLATDGANWQHQLGWMGAIGTECDWQGVFCNEDGSTIQRLALPASGLIGELPAELAALDDLLPGEGLDVCWNDVLVPDELSDLMQAHHLGGDPGYCQGIARLAGGLDRSGQWFQPADRTGEGFMLHMLSAGSAIIKWATYQDNGDPIWLVGTGRMQDRVLHVPDLYHTRLENDTVELERVGRAALALTDDEVSGSDCPLAILRFHVSGSDFGASSGRELRYLDGSPECLGLTPHLPELTALQGSWYDPAQPGQGISLVPHVGDRVIMNWYGHGSDGQQIWQIGVGFPNQTLDRIDFDMLYSAAGGSFDTPLTHSDLQLIPQGSATLQREGEAWRFEALQGDLPVSLLLELTVAGPDLLASTGQRIDLTIDPADIEELYSRSVFSDERLPGSVVFNQNGKTQPLNGLRFRGSSSRLLPKKSFNIRFEDAQPLLFGSDRMNLNAMWTDPSMMREAISFELFHQLGQPAPRTRYFDLWINGIFEGTYLHIQRIDEFFLSMNGLNPEGTLVRDGTRGEDELDERSIFGADLSDLNREARLALLENTFDFRGAPDWPALLELIEWVQSTPPGPAFAEGFEARIDVENFVDWLVLHWLIGDIDSFGDDYWLYLDHHDPDARWKLIPWDKDLSFGSHFRDGFSTHNDFFSYEYPLRGGWENRLIENFLATPSLRQQAHSRLLELVETVFPADWFEERFGAYRERLEDSINIQPGPVAFNLHSSNHFSLPAYFEWQIESLIHFVALRQAFIQRQLAAPGGEDNQASGVLPANRTDRVFFTDQSGAVLASMRPLEPPSTDITVNLVLMPVTSSAAIDRAWQFEIQTEQPAAVELTLHYSNDISEQFGRGNWWIIDDEPKGRQRDLRMLVQSEQSGLSVLENTVNPISNWVQSVWQLESGQTRIELHLPETIPTTTPEIP